MKNSEKRGMKCSERRDGREELRDDAKIDPKVVMNLSMFKIDGWNSFATLESKSVGGIY